MLGVVAQLGPAAGEMGLLVIGDDIETLLSGDEFRSARLSGPEVHRRSLFMIPLLIFDEDSPVRAELVDSLESVRDNRRPMPVRRSREGDLVRVVGVDLPGKPDKRAGESLGETSTP